MTDDSKPDRPNAKYNLSNETPKVDPDEGLTFYYNRERRLEKAPPAVRKLYSAEKHKFSLLRPLIADKPRAFVFMTIVLLCIMIVILGLTGSFGKSYSLDGNKLGITGIRADGVTIIVINKTIKDKSNAFTGAVDIGVSRVSPVDDADVPDYFSHRMYFTLESPEERRFVVPFDDDKLIMVIQTEKSELKLTLAID